ncbi:MAG: hypothetical protein WCF12_12805 [Propionicimonas sp.]
MKLTVLYQADGLIVSLLRLAAAVSGEDGPRPPQIAIEPGAGQRVAIVEVDAAWDQRPLADIHRAFVVVEDSEGVRLSRRDAAN